MQLVFGLSHSNIAKAKVQWISPIHGSITEYFSTSTAAKEACTAFMAPFGSSYVSAYCSVGGWWKDSYNLLKNPAPPNYCTTNPNIQCYYYYNNFKFQQCPSGTTPNRDTGACELVQKNNGPSCLDQANPINASTGNKWQHETDLLKLSSGLGFDRYYNASITADIAHLATGWMHPYAQKISVQTFASWRKFFGPMAKNISLKRPSMHIPPMPISTINLLN
jgi:hypothetical protein